MATVAQTAAVPASVLAQRLAQKKIPSLDGLRAVAVILVILNHLQVAYVPDGRGVLTFFVLSGFLITWILLNESSRYGDVSIHNFYVRRILRIFPAFYVFWIFHFSIFLATHHSPAISSLKDYFSAFFYVSNYRRAVSPHHHYLAHTWALSIEEQFYLLWPWLFVAFHKDLRRLSRILIAIIAVVDLYRIVLFFRFHVPDRWLDVTFDSRMDHLFVGCLLAVLLKRNVLASFWNFVSSRLWISALTCGAIIASIALNEHYHLRYKYAVGFVVDPLLTAILLVQVIALADRWLWRWLNGRFTSYVGRVSYSMFLYHGFTNDLAVRLLHGSPKFLVVMVAIAFAIAAGSISYYAIEVCFLRLKSKFVSHARAAVRDATPQSETALVTAS